MNQEAITAYTANREANCPAMDGSEGFPLHAQTRRNVEEW